MNERKQEIERPRPKQDRGMDFQDVITSKYLSVNILIYQSKLFRVSWI